MLLLPSRLDQACEHVCGAGVGRIEPGREQPAPVIVARVGKPAAYDEGFDAQSVEDLDV
jgi:hypothetical protein